MGWLAGLLITTAYAGAAAVGGGLLCARRDV
jgi:hypothetical protein